MERFLGKYSPYVYAIVRIIAGLMFAMHGSQKLFGWPMAGPAHLTGLLQAAGVIEFVCGLMIALGLLAGYAAFLAAGEMAFAYFIQHYPRGFLPIANQGELAVLNCFLFLYIASQGSGALSVIGASKRIAVAMADRRKVGAATVRFGTTAALGIIGGLAGGFVGFLLRPAAPVVGQLPFSTVISRGSGLKGLDELLVSTAQTSFNCLLAGIVVGAVLGAVAGLVMRKQRA